MLVTGIVIYEVRARRPCSEIRLHLSHVVHLYADTEKFDSILVTTFTFVGCLIFALVPC